MLALNLQVPVRFSLSLTAVSALIAVGFTSIGIGWPFLTAYARSRRSRNWLCRLIRQRKRSRSFWWRKLVGRHGQRIDEESRPFLSARERGVAGIVAEEFTSTVDHELAQEQTVDPVLGPSVLPDSESDSDPEETREAEHMEDLMEEAVEDEDVVEDEDEVEDEHEDKSEDDQHRHVTSRRREPTPGPSGGHFYRSRPLLGRRSTGLAQVPNVSSRQHPPLSRSPSFKSYSGRGRGLLKTAIWPFKGASTSPGSNSRSSRRSGSGSRGSSSSRGRGLGRHYPMNRTDSDGLTGSSSEVIIPCISFV
jgi:hypothetical protein